VSPGTRQEYGYLAKNHIVPYIGHLRISEVNRETFFNLLVNVLHAEEASQNTIRATRKVLSAICQMAFDEGYRNNNPIRSIRLKQAPTKPVLVASHDQWRRLEEAMTYPPARLYARLNVTTWARRCEMIGFRPCDFDFGQQMLNVTRSTVYVNAKYHPSGKAGWFTKPNPKNGDWRRFAISKQMCQAVQEHIEEYGLGPDDLLFPQWMFAYLRSSPIPADDDEHLPPLVSKAGIVYEHGTKGARYSMNCHCRKCKAYAADYQRQWRRQQRTQRASTGEPGKANIWRRDGTEFLMAEVWLRFWNAARAAAGLPEGFTPYNARHTGISWAIDKGVDLQKVRQRAGHGSLEVTSRYAAILDERDTSLADALEEIFDGSRSAGSGHENTTELDDAAGLLSISTD
jgi:integrase